MNLKKMTSNELVEVVSEINTFLTPAASVKPIAHEKNKVAKLTFAAPKRRHVDEKNSTPVERTATVDSDGDLVLPRKSDDVDLEELSLFIEYENSTSLEKVGLQVWRGAFLLADFVIHYKDKYFTGKQILEVGSGTGLTSIIASMFANNVTATDIDDPAILKLIDVNAKDHNKHLIKCQFSVTALDFLKMDWSKQLSDLVSFADVILAADVVYHVNITTAFVRTLRKLVTTGKKSKDIFIAMEKRFVFTVADMDTAAPMYAHFLDELENTLNVYPGCLEKPIQGNDGVMHFLSMQFLPIDFPQYFSYERNAQLVLLHLKSAVKT